MAAQQKRITNVVPLEGPVVMDDGRVISEVTLQRPTVSEVQAFVEAVSADVKEGDAPRVVVPLCVAMSPDDWAAIEAHLLDDDVASILDAAEAFMPRRLKVAAEQSQGSGAPTPAQ